MGPAVVLPSHAGDRIASANTVAQVATPFGILQMTPAHGGHS
jgi:hypothetical protein